MQTAAPVPGNVPGSAAPPRWHRVYFWLAAFDVLTVTLGLLLTHQIMGIYRRSIELNHRWVELLHDSSRLGELAAEVNQPGNEVFKALKSNDPVEKARQIRMQTAARDEKARALQSELGLFTEHLQQVAVESQEKMLQPDLYSVQAALEEMLQHGNTIFANLETNQARAGEAMALMDESLVQINSALARFRRNVGTIQEQYFTEHTEAAARFQRFEYVIGLGILLMVGGATLYGQKLARQAAAYTEALRASELHLERRVRDRTAELEQANAALRAGEDRYRTLTQQVLTAQEDERRRIARDLHDEIGQSLTSLLIGLRTAAEAPSFETARERLGELRRIAGGTLDEVRRLARGLRPSVLDDLGLAPALERYAEDYAQAHGLRVMVHLAGLAERLPAEVETTLYRIVQEALTNTARHAHAETVRITAARGPAGVEVTVADDGCGFDGSGLRERDAGQHLGLAGMRERAGLLHGDVTLESQPGRGTTVRVRIPLTEVKHGEDSRAAG